MEGESQYDENRQSVVNSIVSVCEMSYKCSEEQ
jgi:hypothetical protein